MNSILAKGRETYVVIFPIVLCLIIFSSYFIVERNQQTRPSNEKKFLLLYIFFAFSIYVSSFQKLPFISGSTPQNYYLSHNYV